MDEKLEIEKRDEFRIISLLSIHLRNGPMKRDEEAREDYR